MTTLTVQQLVKSLQEVLVQVDGQTRSDTPIADQSDNKRNYVDWIAVAEAASEAAKSKTSELPKLNQLRVALQYRTQLLKGETPAELPRLMALFKTLSAELFPHGISDEFAEKQLSYLSKTYPAFAKLLEPTPNQLAVDFFRFCLQSPSQSSHQDVPHWVDLFVKYPEIAERLMRSSLYEKLGRFPKNLFVHPEKGVCIKMDLFDENAPHVHITPNGICNFKNRALGGNTRGITLTVEQIFQQFESSSLPDLDVSSTGIINLNPVLLESKDSDGKVHRIDPMRWTEYMPSVELDLNELTKLFPAAKSQPPFAFVLRVNSSVASNGQAFFDFIMKHENGNYGVISLQGHQKTKAPVHQQKSLFYPLSREQGTAVISKVAKDITLSRTAHEEGNPLPSIDVQSYLDEILGHDFYAYLEQLISKPHTYLQQNEKGLKRQLAEVRKNLDTAAFEEFLKPVIDKLIGTRDIPLIHRFITTSLTTIHAVLQRDGSKIVLPTAEQVTGACKELFDKQKSLDAMKPSLLALASLCFEVLHPYRISVAEAEKNTPVIGYIFQKIESIPWVWLKNFLQGFFLTILGPFRGYHYKNLETSHLRPLPRLVQAICSLKPEGYINRPSHLYDSLTEEKKQFIDERLKNQLSILTVPPNA